MGITEIRKRNLKERTGKYRVKVHPQTNRLYHIQMSKESDCNIS